MAELQALDGLKLLKLAKALAIWRGSFALDRALAPEALRLSTYLARVFEFIPYAFGLAWNAKSIRVEIEHESKVIRSSAATLVGIEFARLLLGSSANVVVDEVAAGGTAPAPGIPGTYRIATTTEVSVSGEARVAESVIVAAKIAQWLAYMFAILADIREGVTLRDLPALFKPARFTIDRHET
ncbi:hypothetical protein [Micromonospora sp. NPDC002575]|uniref:hypothetical protein n=1 Tax=Micromonospora sp. NPDC002575 TaxID=3364222 RepID=UPI0036C71C48